jgi:hypothetical protein
LADHYECRDCQKENGTYDGAQIHPCADPIQKPTTELPQLLDKSWYGENDDLSDQIKELKTAFKSELFDARDGYFTAMAKLPEENGFRQAVKDHILARLRAEARDPLSDSIRNPLVATEHDQTIFNELNKSAITKLLENKDEIHMRMSKESVSAIRAEEQTQREHAEELGDLIKFHEERLQALSHTIKMIPNYDINLLGDVVEKQHKVWYRYQEKAQSFNYRFQMRLRGFIASLNTSSDSMMKNDTLALIEKCIGAEPEDIINDEAFW